MDNIEANYKVCLKFVKLHTDEAKRLLAEILKERNKKPTS